MSRQLNYGGERMGDINGAEHVTILDQKTAEQFTCAICFGAPEKAVQACANQHFFCSECLDKACEVKTSCPTCRSDVLVENNKWGFRAPFVENVIGNIMVSCPHGCASVFKFKDLRQHNTTCQDIKVPCPYASCGCSANVARKDMDDHLKDQAINHLCMQNEHFGELVYEAKESSDRARKMVKQSYDKLGNTSLGYFNHLLENQNRIDTHMGILSSQMSQMTSNMAALTGFIADSQVRIASQLTSGKAPVSDSFLAGIKRKAEDLKNTSQCDALLAPLSTTPPSKKQTASPIAPGAPGLSRTSKFLPILRMPLLRDFGNFEGVRVDEADGIDRRNGGRVSPVSPSYSPTTPSYSPTSPNYPHPDDEDDGDEPVDGLQINHA